MGAFLRPDVTLATSAPEQTERLEDHESNQDRG